MAGFDEHLFGRIAVLNGFLTAEQLQECIAIQRQSEPSSSRPRIGDLLRSKGYLDAEQLALIAAIRKQKLRKALVEADELGRVEKEFRRRALSAAAVAVDGLESAILEQQRLHRLGIQVPVWEVLVASGQLGMAKALDLLAQLGWRLMVCQTCDLYYQTELSGRRESAVCATCKGRLLQAPFLDAIRCDRLLDAKGVASAPPRSIDAPLDQIELNAG